MFTYIVFFTIIVLLLIGIINFYHKELIEKQKKQQEQKLKKEIEDQITKEEIKNIEILVEQQRQEEENHQKYLELKQQNDYQRTTELKIEEENKDNSNQIVEAKVQDQDGIDDEIEHIILPSYRLKRIEEKISKLNFKSEKEKQEWLSIYTAHEEAMEAFQRKKCEKNETRLITGKQHEIGLQEELEGNRHKEDEEKRKEKLKWIENELAEYKKQEEIRKQEEVVKKNIEETQLLNEEAMEAFQHKKSVKPETQLIIGKQHELTLQKELEEKQHKEDEERKRKEKLILIESELAEYKRQEEVRKQEELSRQKRFEERQKLVENTRQETEHKKEELVVYKIQACSQEELVEHKKQDDLIKKVNSEFSRQMNLTYSERNVEIDYMKSIILDQEESINGLNYTHNLNYISSTNEENDIFRCNFIDYEQEIKSNIMKIFNLNEKILNLKYYRVKKVFLNDKLIKIGNEISLVKFFLNGFLNIINISGESITVQDDKSNICNVQVAELCEQVLAIKEKSEIIYINEEMYLEVIRNAFNYSLCISTLNIVSEIPFKECNIKMHDKHIYHLFGYKRDAKYKFSESTKSNAIQKKDKTNCIISSYLLFNMFIEKKFDMYEMITPIGQIMGDWLLHYSHGKVDIILVVENEYPKSFLVYENETLDNILSNQIKHNVKRMKIMETYKNIPLNISKHIQESLLIQYYNINNETEYFNKIIALNKQIFQILCENERYFINCMNVKYRAQWRSEKEKRYNWIQRDRIEEMEIKESYLNLKYGDVLIHTRFGRMMYRKKEGNVDYFELDNGETKTFLHGRIPVDQIETICN